MARLEGKIIAATGPRKAEELSRMIAKFGGSTVIRPAQGTVFLDDSRIEEQLRALIKKPADWLLLTTGVGTEALLDIAGKLGLAEPFMDALRSMKLAARGYKTAGTLRKLGLAPLVRDNDGTTAGMLQELSVFDLNGCRVALQLYGDPAPRITGSLEKMGAVCEELLPYRHTPPERDTVELLIDEIVNAKLDAVAFTSTVQARYVMAAARKTGLYDDVLSAFSADVLAVAVGKLTAESLMEEGIERVLFPEEERLGSMVVAMSRYYRRMEGEGGFLAAADGEEAAIAGTAGECASKNIV